MSERNGVSATTVPFLRRVGQGRRYEERVLVRVVWPGVAWSPIRQLLEKSIHLAIFGRWALHICVKFWLTLVPLRAMVEEVGFLFQPLMQKASTSRRATGRTFVARISE